MNTLSLRTIPLVGLIALAALAVATQVQAAKGKPKEMWCTVDKQSGAYTSDCFKTKQECQRHADKKGGGKLTCGITYE